MTYVTTARYAPSEVTPEQLDEYWRKYEAAMQKLEDAFRRYEAAYGVYSDALFECREARDIYEWAKHGMVPEPTTHARETEVQP